MEAARDRHTRKGGGRRSPQGTRCCWERAARRPAWSSCGLLLTCHSTWTSGVYSHSDTFIFRTSHHVYLHYIYRAGNKLTHYTSFTASADGRFQHKARLHLATNVGACAWGTGPSGSACKIKAHTSLTLTSSLRQPQLSLVILPGFPCTNSRALTHKTARLKLKTCHGTARRTFKRPK